MSCVYSSELSALVRFFFLCQSWTHFSSSRLIISFHSHEPLFSLQTSFFFPFSAAGFSFPFPQLTPPWLSVRPKGQTHSQKWTNCALTQVSPSSLYTESIFQESKGGYRNIARQHHNIQSQFPNIVAYDLQKPSKCTYDPLLQAARGCGQFFWKRKSSEKKQTNIYWLCMSCQRC